MTPSSGPGNRSTVTWNKARGRDVINRVDIFDTECLWTYADRKPMRMLVLITRDSGTYSDDDEGYQVEECNIQPNKPLPEQPRSQRHSTVQYRRSSLGGVATAPTLARA